MIKHNITLDENGEGSVTLVHGGALVTVPSTHHNFLRVCGLLQHDAEIEEVMEIIGEEGPVQPEPFRSEPFQPEPFPHDPENVEVPEEWQALVDETTDRILSTVKRYIAEERPTENIVAFLERLQKNPSEESRKALFDWLNRQDLFIDPEGYFIAHKGVYETDLAESGDLPERLMDVGWDGDSKMFMSSSSGHAFVGTGDEDDEEFEGQTIPQWVGATVWMPRDEVDNNSSVDCSTGLHVGSFGYASTFAEVVIEVKIDPADVVSVPRYETTKLRCCRYTVVGVQEQPKASLSHWEPAGTRDISEEALEWEAEQAEAHKAHKAAQDELRRQWNAANEAERQALLAEHDEALREILGKVDIPDPDVRETFIQRLRRSVLGVKDDE